MAGTAALIDVAGNALSPESVKAIEYLRTRAAALGVVGIRERVRAAAQELESAVSTIPESGARARPFPDKWNAAEVVDHIAQTQIRSADELRLLLAGRRPPGPPVYEALRSGAAQWAPWTELVEGLRSANAELNMLLAGAPEEFQGPTVRAILVVNRTLAGGGVAPQLFSVELGWMEYALVQRLHLLDHRTQIKNLRAALEGSA